MAGATPIAHPAVPHAAAWHPYIWVSADSHHAGSCCGLRGVFSCKRVRTWLGRTASRADSVRPAARRAGAGSAVTANRHRRPVLRQPSDSPRPFSPGFTGENGFFLRRYEKRAGRGALARCSAGGCLGSLPNIGSVPRRSSLHYRLSRVQDPDWVRPESCIGASERPGSGPLCPGPPPHIGHPWAVGSWASKHHRQPSLVPI